MFHGFLSFSVLEGIRHLTIFMQNLLHINGFRLIQRQNKTSHFFPKTLVVFADANWTFCFEFDSGRLNLFDHIQFLRDKKKVFWNSIDWILISLLVGILRSPVWISTMLIATNQISECLHNLGVSSWHFATTVTYIMKIHIMEVMNFCLHNRNLFREMLRRYWKRRLQNCLWCQEIQIQSTSWVWWTQFLYLNLPLLLSFCRLCFKSHRVRCNSTRMVQRHMFMVLEDLWFSTQLVIVWGKDCHRGAIPILLSQQKKCISRFLSLWTTLSPASELPAMRLANWTTHFCLNYNPLDIYE
jgi:hypothetical protein